ncbi:ubiquinol-cytochrome c reductase iron-sulfur subunit [Solemya velum gill symbiont]|uniref:Ubiquinol-cytochrome c reductase iron-sulfur subunit n=2 Tax=Solemya velum gill symbiont TaxID=2340 RepID=A0A0B0H5V3_SOVGS|nr:ubiquinol-cytochrome c reductase iron-sulfur subunit [Solemya velum gill symbiont]KHF24042.1 quinol:cytochrome-c oxidoreductase bc1, subunit C [Solemya velum gill symbiont]OOY36192.1 ubiquinol-cytochrome c reductase iron-sulfur subunit [Solemya velum gill symbiont]OOY39592.1 ubiquinol-cytochrome c reductase iron-sulfur subunit [Solemya velum gill symbiont]OOY47983.1 ubiquinol-cytochrome c reductase iron-sulfur subunit [Solemya velum gill symbiont]OOY49452.1 ubiquinol-cytochrome c reductase 
MSEGADLKKRRFLTATTAVIGAVGAVGVAVPFLKSWNPSTRAKAAGAPVEADISKMEPGQLIRVKWRGKPVWVVRRTEKNLEDMKTLDDKLADPASDLPQQPEYAKNAHRSRKPEYLIAVGICTHLGCSPTFRPEVAPADLGPDWLGGFYCACHGSRFDLAGRVYKGVPAPTNLVIPPYQFISDNLLLIGQDGGAA